MKCMLKTLFGGCEQHQIFRKKQTLDLAAMPLSLIRLTVYPIHIKCEDELVTAHTVFGVQHPQLTL